MNSENIDGLSSAGLLNGADEYLQAAWLVHGHQDPNRSLLSPIYFLVCQSLELALKAYLRGKGKTEDFLVRSIGHDLVAALDVAEREGLSGHVKIEAMELHALTKINAYYNSKDLQYALSYFNKSYPSVEVLSALAKKLVVGLDDFCLKTSMLHDGKSTAVVTLRGKRKVNCA